MLEDLSFIAMIIATGLALFATLNQLTSSEKTKRQVATWRVEAEASTDPYDSRILWSLHRSGTAKLVAIDAVPYRMAAILAIFSALLVVRLFQLGTRLGKLSENELRWSAQDDLINILIVHCIFLSIAIFFIFHTFRSRKLVQKLFLERKDLLKKPTIFEAINETGTFKTIKGLLLRICAAMSVATLIVVTNIMVGAYGTVVLIGESGSYNYAGGLGAEIFDFMQLSFAVSLLIAFAAIATLDKKIGQLHQAPVHDSIVSQPDVPPARPAASPAAKTTVFRRFFMTRQKNRGDYSQTKYETAMLVSRGGTDLDSRKRGAAWRGQKNWTA